MAPLLISNVEYVALRLVRRFVFPERLQGIGRYLPFYRTNLAETEPDHICRLYVDWLARACRSVSGKRVAEVGSGATNAVGYALVCAGAVRVWCVEPYVAFDRKTDGVLLQQLSRLHNRDPEKIAAAVTRSDSFASIGIGNADIIFSHSVLEHVSNLATFFSESSTALANEGVMLHIVDYRDHFFKYPLHFLQFSTRTWQKYLDPGDLPRWRLRHHRAALERAGFDVRVLHQDEDPSEFARIRSHIAADFDLEDPSLGVLSAVLYCAREGATIGTSNFHVHGQSLPVQKGGA